MSDNGQALKVRTTATGWALDGELDAHTAPLVVEAVTDLPDAVVDMDLAGLSFMDSSGLRVLVDLTQRARARGFDVAVRNPSPAVRRLVEITGLDDHLTLP